MANRRASGFPSIEKVIADGGFQGKATADDVQDQAGIPLEIVKRSDAIQGVRAVAQALDRRAHIRRRQSFGWSA
jgi:hypothetical protein